MAPMRKQRASTPLDPPSTPGSGTNQGNNIMISQSVVVPPSPAMFSELASPAFTLTPEIKSIEMHKKRKYSVVLGPHPESGVNKARKTTTKSLVKKLHGGSTNAKPVVNRQVVSNVFKFLDLPAEIRNLIYHFSVDKAHQALLVHRPRMASLRARTRLDRSRPLLSDIKDQELHRELGQTVKGRKSSKIMALRESHRPFFGLTQVNRQIRAEFRPIFLYTQEVGMDVTQAVNYLRTFYPKAPRELDKLGHSGQRCADMPFTANLTIAVGDVPNKLERSANGVEILQLLDVWANSFKIEAGFGRYLKARYTPETDGEAKDLYRLFGRRVLANRSCTGMNPLWRTTLRRRVLASVTLHRKPAHHLVSPHEYSALVMARNQPILPILGSHRRPDGNWMIPTKPYIHILFRQQYAEPWMTQLDSSIPKTPRDWLAERGFRNLEYFDIKVGVAPPGFSASF